MNFGENLKKLRKEHKITMDMMAFRSGFSADEIRRFEKSESAPDNTSVRRLAIALGVDPDKLV